MKKSKLIAPVFIFAFLFTAVSVFGFRNLNVVKDHQTERLGLVLGEKEKNEEKKPDVAQVQTEAKEERKEEKKEEKKEDAPRLRIENQGGQVVVTQEAKADTSSQPTDTPSGKITTSPQTPAQTTVKEIEVSRKDVYEIEEPKNKYLIKVATGSGDSMLLVRTNAAAKVNQPIYLDPNTNELKVPTTSGEKTLNYLPDAIVANVVSYNVLDLVQANTDESRVNDNIATQVQKLIELKEDNGDLVYEVQGEKKEKVFGLFPVTILQKAIVSAETGELLRTVRSLRGALIDLISF